MEFASFEKCMKLISDWRVKTEKTDTDWPDSRDPDFQKLMNDSEVVPQDLEKSMIALAAWRSSGRSSIYQDISSIVHVIRNRQKAGMFRSHLTDKDQFPEMSCTYEIYVYPKPDQEFEKVLKNLDDILESKTVDITQGSIYFWTINDHMPQWFRDIVVSPDMERTVSISGVTFYKPKAAK